MEIVIKEYGEYNMKLYKLTVKGNAGYDCYDGFMVAADTIPEAFEYMYRYVCKTDKVNVYNDIPFYLRSSNINIEELGEFRPKEKYPKTHILMVDYAGA